MAQQTKNFPSVEDENDIKNQHEFNILAHLFQKADFKQEIDLFQNLLASTFNEDQEAVAKKMSEA
jgi:hypothetical protein